MSSLVEPADPESRAVDALMNAESSSDNDIHGEGSQSQQQDLRMAQEVVLEGPEADNEMENSEEDPGDYDEEQQDDEEEDQADEDEEQSEEMDAAEEEILLQQPVPMDAAHRADIEEADEMMGRYAIGDDNEDMDEDDLDDEEMDDMDDMPSDEEDQMMMPVGMGAHPHRGRHGRNERVPQRDILFNAGEAPPGHAAFMGERLRLEREHAVADLGRAQGGPARGGNNHGPNWSQEEEEVSQILRNLRGLSQNGAAAGPESNPHAPGQVAP